eukprot:TRINITY_DN97_c0_g5_i1.p1 TRINITY_DN97_c0_g5~~TRINITY_DN97_c0_g5_i1.p1  ORF type:complete len:1302 (+),score=375.13 TRINITY_DN97_c0_g5_i1:49-3906(+)
MAARSPVQLQGFSEPVPEMQTVETVASLQDLTEDTLELGAVPTNALGGGSGSGIQSIPQVASTFVEKDTVRSGCSALHALPTAGDSTTTDRSWSQRLATPLRGSMMDGPFSPQIPSSQWAGAGSPLPPARARPSAARVYPARDTLNSCSLQIPPSDTTPSCYGSLESFLGRLTAAPSDDIEERARKVEGLIISSVGAAAALVSAALHAVARAWPATAVDAAVGCLLSALAAMILTRRQLPALFVDAAGVALAAAFCVCDFFTVGGGDVWLLALLPLYGLVQCGSREPLPFAACCLVVSAWLALRMSEEAAGWGLYDPVHSAAFGPRCPHAGWSLAAAALVRRLVVWLLSCLFCRQQAAMLRREHMGATAATKIAKQVAEALVRFDLYRAEALVNKASVSVVPPCSANGQASPCTYKEDGLMAAFRELLANLRMYRPFLPEALFVSGDGGHDGLISWAGGDETGSIFSVRNSGLRSARPSNAGSPRGPLRRGSPASHQGNGIAPVAPQGPPGTVTVGVHPRPRSRSASLSLLYHRGAGLRLRRGTTVRVQMSAAEENPFCKIHGGIENHVTTLSSRLAAPVFQHGRAAGGIVILLGVDHVVLTWNTHQPQPRHAQGASSCALRVSDHLAQLDGMPQCSVVVATGQVLAGASGTQEHLAAVVSGPSVELSAALVKLCPRIGSPCVCDDNTWDLLRGDFIGRIVDAVRMSSLDKDVYVYEMLQERIAENSPDQLGQIDAPMPGLEHVTESDAMRRYAQAFAALRQLNYAQAKSHLSTQLKLYPGDFQAHRLLRITHLLNRKTAREGLGLSNWDCYVRVLGSWFDFESRADSIRIPSIVPKTTDLDGGDVCSPLPRSPASSFRHSTVSTRSLGGSSVCSSPMHAALSMTRGCSGGLRHSSPAITGRLGLDTVQSRDMRGGPLSARSARSSTGSIDSADTDDQRLRRAIMEGYRRKSSSGEVVYTSGGKENEVPREFIDQRGRRWYRGNRALGKGAYGVVYLGMGTDGGLVALKQVELPKALMPRDKRRLSGTLPSGADVAVGTLSDPEAAIFPFRAPTDDDDCKDTAAMDTMESLLNEIAVMDALRHENIVSYLGCTLANNHVVIVLEYMPGGSLSGVLSHFGGKLPETSVRRYLIDVLKGLAFLHAHAVVHRDIKPPNVLVTAEGNGKLADFGACAELCKLVAGEGTAVIGTPQYMAPEACSGHACPASDIWSVGIMAAELLTGKVPWTWHAAPHLFIRKVGHEGALPSFHGLAEMSLALNFCESCCRREPDGRPSAQVVRDHAFLIS